MNRVSLSKDEAAWFSRNVVKMVQLLEDRAQKDPEVLKRSTYKTLKSMLKSANDLASVIAQLGTELADLDVTLVRKQKLVIKQLIDSVNQKLKDFTIPTYERRGESHKTYLDNAVRKAEMLDQMSRKFR